MTTEGEPIIPFEKCFKNTNTELVRIQTLNYILQLLF